MTYCPNLLGVRLMERAGVEARSARVLPWYENEKEAYQHHAQYLKRLSKLREELIQQEQNNLAHALDRLRMRSYGREFVYSQSPRKSKQQQRYTTADDNGPSKKYTLLTTFEKFQRNRPRQEPPMIMPLEGRSLIDAMAPPERTERYEKQRTVATEQSGQSDRGSERSVEENVRVNLQRLTSHPVPSIPGKGRNRHNADLLVESNSIKRANTSGTQDTQRSVPGEDRITHMQRQKQKMMKLRHEGKMAETLRLAPQTVQAEILPDDDRMDIDKLKDYYCIYCENEAEVPGSEQHEMHVHLPKLTSNSTMCNGDSNNHGGRDSSVPTAMSSRTTARHSRSHRTPADAQTSCSMYVTGSKVDTPLDHNAFSISKTYAANTNYESNSYHPNTPKTPKRKSHINVNNYIAKNDSFNNNDNNSINFNDAYNTTHYYRESKDSSRGTDRSQGMKSSAGRVRPPLSPRTSPELHTRKVVHVDMPTIVCDVVISPPPPQTPTEPVSTTVALTKAFKQKELRKRELTNLKEDIREINRITELLEGADSDDDAPTM